MTHMTEAVDLFKNGCACSQAILGAYASDVGLDRTAAMRIAAGFAGGMRAGGTCGAVTGAIMVLGLKYCTDGCERYEGRQRAYEAVQEFQRRFAARNGSMACETLLGVNISTAEGMQAAKDRGLFADTCPRLVQSAAEILGQVMGEE